ncbi:hypothetical protein F8C76_02075 [Flagellimonas olearia]|uniref:Uncharacterized protein n=1 Tax=Flagellimonas olearia TaxID=552546 RepID=A0A6I1DYF9_9FLAO|nr:hypothetical protein [Allomuricauda olearia]KAB7530318.1 hypothetical protein F8C76_02075 [Allomuricauda olearia]
MLEDGFKSVRYSAILGNLRDNGHLEEADIKRLLHNYMTTQRIDFEGIPNEKAKIVTEALIDNYHRIMGS